MARCKSSSLCFSLVPSSCQRSSTVVSYLAAHRFYSRQARVPRVSLAFSHPMSYRRNMSGFLSSEAERALEGEEAEAQRLFYEAMMNDQQQQARRQYPQASSNQYPAANRTRVPYIQQPDWSHTYSSVAMAPYPIMQPTPVLPSSPYVMSSSSEPGERPSQSSWNALNPQEGHGPRSRAASGSSDHSRSSSPNPAELHNFGYPLSDGRSWRCAHTGCTSQAVFTRGCDLRKHFRRHTKSLFCRHEGCAQSTEGGFSSKKDRDRHEAKHKPGIPCQWEGCERVFSRVDNMKDHVRRIHHRST